MDRPFLELVAEVERLRRIVERLDNQRPQLLYTRGGGGGGAVSLPTAEHQWMVYQMVSENQSGWDFMRAHPI